MFEREEDFVEIEIDPKLHRALEEIAQNMSAITKSYIDRGWLNPKTGELTSAYYDESDRFLPKREKED